MYMNTHIRLASISSDSAFQLLDKHKKEFAGTSWMPANFFQRKRIVFLLQKVSDLYKDIEEIDFAGMSGETQLVKAKYQMWLDLRLAYRWQVKDHMRLMEYLSEALKSSRIILERLRVLSITGQITRNTLTDVIHDPYNLLD